MISLSSSRRNKSPLATLSIHRLSDITNEHHYYCPYLEATLFTIKVYLIHYDVRISIRLKDHMNHLRRENIKDT